MQGHCTEHIWFIQILIHLTEPLMKTKLTLSFHGATYKHHVLPTACEDTQL